MKSIAIAGAHGMLAASVVTMGAILLVGTGLHAPRMIAAEIGDVGRMVVGATEIVAGLCLILPRAHVIGTMLLAFLTVGVLAMIVGRSIERDPMRFGTQGQAIVAHPAVARAGGRSPAALRRLSVPRELII